MANNLGGTYAVYTPITGNYTVLVTDDAVIATLTAAATVTLYNPSGVYARASPPGGRIMIVNVGTSTNTLTVAAASGSIVGPTVLSPGQSATYISDGAANWYAEAGSSGGVGGTPATTRVALSSANILGMAAAPVQLIAAPGAGNLIVMDDAVIEWLNTATQYASGGVVILQYGNSATGAGTNAMGSTITAAMVTAAVEDTTVLRGGAVGVAATTALNAGIFISNQTGAFTTGTGTARATLRYHVVTP